MQNYKEINGNDYVKDSRTTINETMRSIQSMNSGTVFPTTNLFEGMKCYRTDLKKTYTLTDVENNTWVEDAHAELADEATHAASATKLQTPRALNLSGAVTADAASFDGTADATINVKTLDASKLKGTASVSTTGNAATATKLATARTIALSGNATGSTTFDGSGNATINVTVNESAHAAKATQDTNGRAFTDTNAYMHISYLANGTDFNNVKTTGIYYCTQDTFPNRPHNSWGILTVYSIGTVKQEYKPDNAAVYYTREYNNSNWKAWSKVAASTADTCTGNAATASKLLTPRTISLTGKAAGSTSFDGSANASINVTSVNADTASKLSTARKINITGNATGAANFDGSGDVNISVTVNESKHAVNADTATHANDIADATMNMTASTKENAQTTAASGVIGVLENLTGSTDLTSMNKLRSFVGSVSANDWYDVISIRHRNGAGDGQDFGLLMYSGLANTDSIKYKKQPHANFWTEERTILDSSNYNSYAPTKTGGGASGTWNISVSGNAATATKATSATTAAACSGNSATATKLATPRTISLTGNAIGSANFDGSGNISINTTVNNSAAASVVQRVIQPRGLYAHNAYVFYGTLTIPQQGDFFKLEVLGGNGHNGNVDQSEEGTLYFRTGNNQPANFAAYSEYHRNGSNGLKFFIVKDSGTQYRIYSDKTYFTGVMQVLPYVNNESSFDLSLTTVSALPSGAVEVESRQLVYTDMVNNYAPTKTGSGASGTWPISINGNADTVDGYHASDIISKITAANTGGIVAASLTANGYVKFANGLILQWGSNTGGGSWYHHTFPIAFSTVFDVIDGYSSTSTGQFYGYSKNITNTGFDMRIDSSKETGRYIAIGI